jgi:hypothetical protein
MVPGPAVITVCLFVIVAGWLMWAIPRDLERAVQRRRLRQIKRLTAQIKSMSTAFQQMGASMKRATTAMQRFGERMRDGNVL